MLVRQVPRVHLRVIEMFVVQFFQVNGVDSGLETGQSMDPEG